MRLPMLDSAVADGIRLQKPRGCGGYGCIVFGIAAYLQVSRHSCFHYIAVSVVIVVAVADMSVVIVVRVVFAFRIIVFLPCEVLTIGISACRLTQHPHGCGV